IPSISRSALWESYSEAGSSQAKGMFDWFAVCYQARIIWFGLDLTGLTLVVTYASLPAQIFPVLGQIVTGSGGATDGYEGSISGPTSFGGVFFTFASSGSGDSVGIFRDTSTLLVPSGYVSGTALSDSATYNNATFASLGVTPGTYVWTWGAGANQNFKLQIGPAGVPDGVSTVSLLGFALLGFAALVRKLSC